jgi:signal transduction histidine kinase/ActR/RegA family two-component response regulator
MAEVRERFLSLLLPGLRAQEDMTAVWNEAAGPLRFGDVAHRMPDGSLRAFEVVIGRCNWSGRPAFAVRIDDVTAVRQSDEARTLAARMEAVRSVSAGAAQALNDALTAVRGNLDLLSKQNTARADARDLLENAAAACERAEDTVRTLANLARAAGQSGSRRRLVDLRQFLPRAISFAALRGRLIPAFNLAAGLNRIEVDEVPLKEAMLALVENADQASKGVGTLEINAWNLAPAPGHPGRVVIEFRDRGEGIPGAHLSKVFDPYFTTREGRQGLGLSRALAIVSAQGGTIEVESAPAEGSAFRMILPAAAGVTVVAAPPAERNVEPAAPAHGRVLVMDDDAGIRVIVEKILTMQGFDVYTVRDGQEAIDAYRRAIEMKSPFDVVLLDLDVRGGMGGRECIARLRGEFPGVRAVLTTGYLDDTLLENHREHGFSGVITKPFNVERLVSTVSKLASA